MKKITLLLLAVLVVSTAAHALPPPIPPYHADNLWDSFLKLMGWG